MQRIKKYFLQKKYKVSNFLEKYIDRNAIKVLKEDKNFKTIIKSILFFIIIITTILFLKSMKINSQKEVLETFRISVENNDLRKLASCIRIEDKKVNKEELNPILEYLNERDQNVKAILSELMDTKQSLFFEVKKEKDFFRDNYYLNVNKVTLELNSNIENTTITLLNPEVSGIDYMKIEVIPGVNQVYYKLDTEYGEILGNEKIIVLDNEVIDLNIDAKYININSNINDADVYINEKNTNKKVNEFKDYGPIPLDADIKIKLKKESPWGILESENIVLGEENLINVNINIINDKFSKEINETIEKFYQNLFYALNSKDYNKIQNVNAEAKEKIYKNFYQEYIIFSNNYNIESFDINIEKSECEYNDNQYDANILTKIKYKVSKKLLPFLNEEKEEVFLLGMSFSDGKWQINDFQDFDIQ